MPNKTKLSSGSATFSSMMERFGVVTVMNVDVYDASDIFTDNTPQAISEIEAKIKTATKKCTLDTLKIANVTVDGPSKTVTGGQYANPLIKFGKSARLEMQDALGNAHAIDALCGGIEEFDDTTGKAVKGLHYGEDFEGPKTIVGHSFFIDQKKGQQVPVKIIFFQFLPDSIFNLTQDSEGDATVFDMNGDLMTTVVNIPDSEGTMISHGLFYSILPESAE